MQIANNSYFLSNLTLVLFIASIKGMVLLALISYAFETCGVTNEPTILSIAGAHRLRYKLCFVALISWKGFPFVFRSQPQFSCASNIQQASLLTRNKGFVLSGTTQYTSCLRQARVRSLNYGECVMLGIFSNMLAWRKDFFICCIELSTSFTTDRIADRLESFIIWYSCIAWLIINQQTSSTNLYKIVKMCAQF